MACGIAQRSYRRSRPVGLAGGSRWRNRPRRSPSAERSSHFGAEIRAAGAEPRAATERLVRMDFYTEQEVAVTAKFMGYDLLRMSDGYRLTRDMDFEQEIIEADSLEMIADFLKQ
jgi:hypothetical protein